jgi:hypothetical protein
MRSQGLASQVQRPRRRTAARAARKR